MKDIEIKRAYDATNPNDGFRVFIDRLWPRGLTHEAFHYDLWDKDVAPSTELREWYHADPEARWPEFEKRYRAELSDNPAFIRLVGLLMSHPVVTLLYASHDMAHNNAVVVRRALDEIFSRPAS